MRLYCVSVPYACRVGDDLHGNACDDVRSIPERNVSFSTRWRIPRHDYQVQVDQNVESQYRVPDLEAGSW